MGGVDKSDPLLLYYPCTEDNEVMDESRISLVLHGNCECLCFAYNLISTPKAHSWELSYRAGEMTLRSFAEMSLSPGHLSCRGNGENLSKAKCSVCSRKRERGRNTTTYTVGDCNVPCFKLHHTKVIHRDSICLLSSHLPIYSFLL